MNKKKILSLLVLIMIGVGGGSFVLSLYYYYNPIFSESKTPLRYFWVYPTDLETATNTIVNNSSKIDILSPTLFGFFANGTIESGWINQMSNDNNKQILQNFLSTCVTHNISVQPMIASGNSTLIRQLLEDPAHIQNFIDSVISYISEYEFDGVNIDFEHLDEDLGNEFLNFLSLLKEGLGSNITLSTDLPALTHKIRTGWGAWVDYKEIGKIADYVMIMTYDAHGGWSDPGEVAPISWVKDVIAYANSKIPIENLFMGIPRYGYDWSDNPNWENWGYGLGFFESTYNLYGGTRTRTDDGYEIRYEYTDSEGYDHLAYYCDLDTTLAKESFLSGYPVAGYCYWHFNSGDLAYFL